MRIRIVWSRKTMQLVEDLGVTPAEVNRCVQAVGRRAILTLEDQPGLRIIADDGTDRLIETWLVPTHKGWYEVIGAFEAGPAGKMRWHHAQEAGDLI